MKKILTTLFIVFGLFLTLNAQALTQSKAEKKNTNTKKTQENFYFLGIKLGYGSFNTGVELESKSNVKVTHMGIRYMMLFNTGDYTTLGIMGDFFYSKRGYELFENGFFSNEKKLSYFGQAIFFTVKHRWFYFGVGYETLFWDKNGELTFEHKHFEHFVTLTTGFISSNKIKFFIGIEIKTALFKLNSFEYNGETYTPGQNNIEYLVTLGVGF